MCYDCDISINGFIVNIVGGDLDSVIQTGTLSNDNKRSSDICLGRGWDFLYYNTDVSRNCRKLSPTMNQAIETTTMKGPKTKGTSRLRMKIRK